MSRLIDVDSINGTFAPNETYTGRLVIALLNQMPTAYDVDKVVKELEERMEKAMSISEKSAELGKAYERHMLYQGGKGNAFDEAIEIVKEVGGTNEV